MSEQAFISFTNMGEEAAWATAAQDILLSTDWYNYSIINYCRTTNEYKQAAEALETLTKEL